MTTVVFDFDGTLVDSESVYLDGLHGLLADFDIESNDALFEDLRSRHPDRLFDHILGVERGQEALARFKEMGERYSKDVKLFDGVADLLDDIKAKGHFVGLWTARDRHSTATILEHLGLENFFDVFRSGTCVSLNKPAADGLVAISKALGEKYEDILMVGDHSHDIQAANAVGSSSIFARWKPNPNTLVQGLEANETFDCIASFRKWLLEG